MSSKNDTTRARILQAARRLLEAGGGSGVRMSDIAREVGISRQALYLHFPKRADLLVATTRYLDELKNVEARLAPSRAARLGAVRLDAFIEAWGNYIPEIYGVGKALMAMQDSDEEARRAWEDRMQAVRQGCEAVDAIAKDGRLAKGLSREHATDLLWTLLSVRNWEQLTLRCGWSQSNYIATLKMLSRKALISGEA